MAGMIHHPIRYDFRVRTFSVSLKDWFTVLKNPAAIIRKAPNRSATKLEVNFIQVCRNYFEGHAWTTQEALECMYQSAIATYTYPNCPAIDLVSAIRVSDKKGILYHPLLVSVKCCKQPNINEAFDKMKELLVKVRAGGEKCPKALCLLIVIGAAPAWGSEEFFIGDINSFPKQDTFRLIAVRENDLFDIHNNVIQVTQGQQMAQLITSHPHARSYSNRPTAPKRGTALRKKSSLETKKLFNELCNAYHERKGSNKESPLKIK
jgi:hypothetical protein